MRILADLNISPVTVSFLKTLGHDVIRINAILTPTATDREVIEAAVKGNRIILTHDLDFSEIIGLSGSSRPSLISLRLSSADVEFVNRTLEKVLPSVEHDLETGAIVSVEDHRTRIRRIPFS